MIFSTKTTKAYTFPASQTNDDSVFHVAAVTTSLRSEITVLKVPTNSLTEALNELENLTIPSLALLKCSLNLSEPALFCGVVSSLQSNQNGKKRGADDSQLQENHTNELVVITKSQALFYDLADFSLETKREFGLGDEPLDAVADSNKLHILLKASVVSFETPLLDLEQTSEETSSVSKLAVDSEGNLITIGYDSGKSEMTVSTHGKTRAIHINVGEDDDDDEPNRVVQVAASHIHKGLLYVRFSRDDFHIYVYSISLNKLSYRLNSVESITGFSIFRLKNSEIVVSTNFGDSGPSVEFFKCVFRKNAVNVNLAAQVSLVGVKEAVSSVYSNGELVFCALGPRKLGVFAVESALSTKQSEVSINMGADNISKLMKSLNLEDKKLDKKARRKKKRAIITGYEPLDKLLAEFKIVKTDTYNLCAFCIQNNDNLVLIKTVIKNSKSEELEQIWASLLRAIEDNEKALFGLTNWLRMMLLFMGGGMQRGMNKKRFVQLKRLQLAIKGNTEDLGEYVSLQGKVDLLRAQYEVRKGEREAGEEGVQVIEEDDVVYENGEGDGSEANESD